MITFLLITGIVMLALGLVSYASSKRAAHRAMTPPRFHCSRETSNTKVPVGRFRFLLSHHDVDRHQHHPHSGSAFFSVNRLTANEEHKGWPICTRFSALS